MYIFLKSYTRRFIPKFTSHKLNLELNTREITTFLSCNGIFRFFAFNLLILIGSTEDIFVNYTLGLRIASYFI